MHSLCWKYMFGTYFTWVWSMIKQHLYKKLSQSINFVCLIYEHSSLHATCVMNIQKWLCALSMPINFLKQCWLIIIRPGVKYVFVFVFANTNTGVFVFVFEWIWNRIFVFVFVFDSRIWCIWQIRYQIQSIFLQILSTGVWMYLHSLWYVISCIRDILSGALFTQKMLLFNNWLSPWGAE